jgi:anionic cell wall polymer biosynthesis LytR-Cps2A-Psr (LCP) family protein
LRRGVTDASVFLVLVIVLLLAGAVFVVLNVLRSDPIEEALSGEEVINILFVFEGTDKKPLGSYVLMFSPMNNRAAAISIPGNVGMILKTTNRVDRIDSVYQNGSETYCEEIESLLGLSIRYTVVFEAERLSRIVDVIEGVELFIPVRIEQFGDEPVLFSPGNTVLDGDKALQYIGFTFPEEDENAALLRRESFFLGLLESLGQKKDMFTNSSLARYFYPQLKSNMNSLTRRRLFDALALLDIDRIGIQTVAGTYREVSGQNLFMPYYDGTVIKDVARQAQRSLSQKTSGTLVERVFTVEILNGTATTGLASRTAELVRGFRYDVIATNNADRNDYEETEIIDRTGLDEVAKAFADIIRCKNLRFESKIEEDPAATEWRQEQGRGSEIKADFTLIIGKDFNGRVVTGN